MLFAFSYAFQISGAIILLLWSLKSVKQNVFELYFPGSNVIERDENDICILDKEKLQKGLQTILQNIFAFVDLIVGYSMAIFAEKLFENCKTFVIVWILTLTITGIEHLTAVIIAKIRYPKDISIAFDEVQKYKTDVGTFVTEREIDQMFNEVFDTDSKE